MIAAIFTKSVVVSIAAVLAAGCATIARGTSEDVTVNSDPPGAFVETTAGLTCPATPCTWKVPRKQEFVATFRLDGYEPVQIPVQTKVGTGGAVGFTGNVLAGGVVGMVADAGSGATLDHDPNPVFAQLTPIPRTNEKMTPRVRRSPASRRPAEPQS